MNVVFVVIIIIIIQVPGVFLIVCRIIPAYPMGHMIKMGGDMAREDPVDIGLH